MAPRQSLTACARGGVLLALHQVPRSVGLYAGAEPRGRVYNGTWQSRGAAAPCCSDPGEPMLAMQAVFCSPIRVDCNTRQVSPSNQVRRAAA